MKLFVSMVACLLPAAAQSLIECQTDQHYGRIQQAHVCYSNLARSADPYLRAEGLWALRDFKGANEAFRLAVAQHPKNPEYRVRWGRMFIDHAQAKSDYPTAAKLFQEALEIKKDDAGALLGLGLLAARNFDPKAADYATQALKADPKLVEAQELLARMALEDNNPQKAVAEADKALAMSPEALNAMAIRATVDWLDDKKDSPWMARILKINPVDGEAYETAGYFFVTNRRYEEGIQFYRKALELDPNLWSARSALGVNLMRIGHPEEARKQLEECFNHGYESDETVNTLRLLDSYKHFVTFKTPTTVLVLDKKEADVLRPYFQAELDRAIATYEKKYKMKLDKPVQVEVYPNHEDFAVRTMGLPGLGALGVTFGTVVAMDSPSGRPPGSFHWDSTMWHELSHVFVLTATSHHVPRWFTEGVAVHEETAASPDWGDRLDPEAIRAIKEKKLLPVAELDRGFVHPSYPQQVIISYFQAGKICDYIVEMWGNDKLLAMIHAFSGTKTTPEVIEEQLGMKSTDFDKKFLAWLDNETKKQVEGFSDWKTRLKAIAEADRAKKYDDVIAEGNAIRDIYPDYVEAGSVYEFLADAYAAKGDQADARKQLEQYAKIGGRSPLLLKRLAALEEQAGDKKQAAATLERLNLIYPVDPELHQRLGALLLANGDAEGAVREYRVLVAEKPIDVAGAHYELAKACQAAGHKDEAKDEVLTALEAAPNYKPAQRLLLELSGKD